MDITMSLNQPCEKCSKPATSLVFWSTTGFFFKVHFEFLCEKHRLEYTNRPHRSTLRRYLYGEF